MKTLYEVEARWYVMAENKEDAEEIRPSLLEVSLSAIKAAGVDAEWGDSIPFGGDDDKTCGQIFKESK